MCGRPWPAKPVRVCGDCGGQILKGHKFYFDGSVVKHRDCKDPSSYTKPLKV